MLDEQQFQTMADQALTRLEKALNAAAEVYDFEADMNNGALTVEFEEPPAKFVVSPNSPVRQIWISAHQRSFKLDWIADRQSFVLAATGQDLNELMAEQISKQMDEEVTL